jgi:acetyl-CoA/propionyl-CoA carboxylase biotin carboxyl carrier protein
MRVRLSVDGVPHEVLVSRDGETVELDVDGTGFTATVKPLGGGRVEVRMGKRARLVEVLDDSNARLGDKTLAFRVLDFDPADEGTGAGAGDGVLRPPMPGSIARILVGVGDRVSKAAPLVVLEAMKMQNEIVAPFAGTVRKLHVKAGDTVTLNDIVIEIEMAEAKV